MTVVERIHITSALTIWTRHKASTNTYSLTFRVRVTVPSQYGRNGMASLQITSRTQQALSLARGLRRHA